MCICVVGVRMCGVCISVVGAVCVWWVYRCVDVWDGVGVCGGLVDNTSLTQPSIAYSGCLEKSRLSSFLEMYDSFREREVKISFQLTILKRVIF